LRVAIDATALGSGRGGDETYLLGLLRALEATRDQDDVFPLYLCREVAAPLLGPDTAFPLRRLRSRSRIVRYLWELPRALSSERQKADLVLGTNHAPLFSSTPRALIVHDLSFHHYPEFYPTSTRWRLDVLVPLHLRQARVVLTGSEFTRADLMQTYGLPDDLVHVVPPVIESRMAAPDGPRLRSALGVSESYFLYVGNLHPRKNLHRLVEAFVKARERSPAVHRSQLVIAGAAWWGDDSLSRAIAHLPPQAVLHVGRVSDEERDALFRGTLALAYPSLFEGIGLPPLEAMSAGAPVLAARASSLPEVLGDAALFVDPRDTDEMALCLQRLAEDRALREGLRERGLRRAARFTPAAAGERALKAFDRALRTSGATY